MYRFRSGASRVVEDGIQPGIAFESDDGEVVHARRRPWRRKRDQRLRPILRGGEDMMVQLVLIRPPVGKDVAAAPGVVNAEKTSAVAACPDRRLGKHASRGALRRGDEFSTRI